MLDHLDETLKNKLITTVDIKLINDPYREQEVNYSYLLLVTQADYGLSVKSLTCYLC